MRTSAGLFCVAFLIAKLAFSQNAGISFDSTGPVVMDAPYSGEEVVEHVRTLADGTHLTTGPTTVKVYRDSHGRTRRETSPIVQITDPIASVRYTLDAATKIAHRTPWKLEQRPCGGSVASIRSSSPISGEVATTPPPRALSSTERLQQSQEDLGTREIQGVMCRGRRSTTTWPTGSSLGNDGPVSAVVETWVSLELHLFLVTKSSDPRTGERTERLINISRSEPASELFQPPADYQIVDGPSTGASRTFPAPCIGAVVGGVPEITFAQVPPTLESGVYRIGGDVSAPIPIFKPEPKYSEEARQAKYSGSVLLAVIIDENGLPRNIKVIRPLGLGLDEKAIEALTQWRFRPAMKDGKAVKVTANVEMTFRLQ